MLWLRCQPSISYASSSVFHNVYTYNVYYMKNIQLALKCLKQSSLAVLELEPWIHAVAPQSALLHPFGHCPW